MISYTGNTDPTTRRMLEGILAMEEEHAEDLATLLATLDPPEGGLAKAPVMTFPDASGRPFPNPE